MYVYINGRIHLEDLPTGLIDHLLSEILQVDSDLAACAVPRRWFHDHLRVLSRHPGPKSEAPHLKSQHQMVGNTSKDYPTKYKWQNGSAQSFGVCVVEVDQRTTKSMVLASQPASQPPDASTDGCKCKLLLNEGYIFWWIAFSVSAQFPVGLWCTIFIQILTFRTSNYPIYPRSEGFSTLNRPPICPNLENDQRAEDLNWSHPWWGFEIINYRGSGYFCQVISEGSSQKIMIASQWISPNNAIFFHGRVFFSYPRGTSGVARWGVLTSRGSKVTIAWTSLGWCSSKRRRANRIRCSVGWWGLTIPNC